MPSHGPWETPAEQSVPITVAPSSFVIRSTLGDATTYPDVCESTTTVPIGSDTFATASVDNPFAHVDQTIAVLSITSAVASYVDYTPTMPPNATAVEYEGGGPDETWTASVTATLSLEVENLSSVDTIIQARAKVPAFSLISGGITFTPGAALSTLTLIGSVPLPAGTTAPQTLPVTIPGSAVSPGAPGNWYAPAVLHFAGQISHVGPSGSHQWVTLVSTAALPVTVAYQPRRYRFVYDVLPRLRQFPRDDALGGAPRQGKANGSTSVQSSSRQGWRNTYR